MRISERHRKAAANLQAGMKIYPALIDAGFSPATARNGMAAVRKPILKAMGKDAKKFIELGRITAEDQELMVRGRLVHNTIVGKDSGVTSAKALGSDRRVNMFTPESVSNVIVVTPPAQASQELLESED